MRPKRVPVWLLESLARAVETDDVLIALGALGELAGILTALERDLIEIARAGGYTWARIAAALELETRQGAHARAVRLGARIAGAPPPRSTPRVAGDDLLEALAVPVERRRPVWRR